MGLLDLIFKIYAGLLLIRILVSDVGQMGYNPVFQWITKLTDPVLIPLKRWLKGPVYLGPILVLLGLIIFQGLFFSGSSYHQGKVFELGPLRWVFHSGAPLWWLGRSLFSYLIFFYQFLAFFLILSWLWRDSLVGLGRLVRQVSGSIGMQKAPPALRLGIVVVVFSLALYGGYGLGAWLGWFPAGSLPPLVSGAVALWLLLNFSTIFIFLIVIRAVLSFFSPIQGEYTYLLTALTDPFLRPLRQLNLRIERWDLTPAVAIFGLIVIRAAGQAILMMIIRAS